MWGGITFKGRDIGCFQKHDGTHWIRDVFDNEHKLALQPCPRQGRLRDKWDAKLRRILLIFKSKANKEDEILIPPMHGARRTWFEDLCSELGLYQWQENNRHPTTPMNARYFHVVIPNPNGNGGASFISIGPDFPSDFSKLAQASKFTTKNRKLMTNEDRKAPWEYLREKRQKKVGQRIRDRLNELRKTKA